MRIDCIIFDLDGTLVDSETLCNQAFIDLLPNLTVNVKTLVQLYRGKKLADILADIEQRLGIRLPDQFEQQYRQHVAGLFARELKPMPGVINMLAEIQLPMGIASHGPLLKIRQALQVCGLSAFFGEHIFSAYEVGCWKPDPGLFLFAAQAMAVNSPHCLVVDDSGAGIKAAIAAGMPALLFEPEPSNQFCPPVAKFNHMSQLPALIANWPPEFA
ncbi:MAG: HAD-IA family hydrolase [Methylococcaceae bacterium]|jgi:HAD superfamily hydrolase (TIGR01509 family)